MLHGLAEFFWCTRKDEVRLRIPKKNVIYYIQLSHFRSDEGLNITKQLVVINNFIHEWSVGS